MKTIIIKLLRDLWRTKGKFLLCVLAASLSAWGISGVFYSYLMSERDFEVNFSATNPAEIIIKIENNTPELLQKLNGNAHIAKLERREMLSARVRNADGNWMPIMIQVVESLEQVNINKFKVVETIDNKPNTVFIEQNGALFLDASSEEIVVQIGGQDSIQIKKGGYVHDAGQAPSRMERMVYAYIPITAMEPYLNKTSQRFLIKTTEKNLSGADLQMIGNELKTIVESNGGTLTSINIPPPGEHPHQNIVDGISFLQQTFGFVLSLLGVALLSLILLTWLYPQIPQIGIMKAVGSFTQKIFWSYVIILLFIISLGLFIGMPLGYQTAIFYNNFIAYIQNFTPITTTFPIATHLPVALTASIIPIIFCIFPLLQASRTSVRSALSKTFYTSQKGIFQLSQNLISDSRWKYGINNIFRNSQNTALLILILTVGIGLFFTGANLKYSIKKDFEQYFEANNYELAFYLADSQQVSTNFLEELPFVASVAKGDRKSVVFQAPSKDYQDNSIFQVFSNTYKLSPELLLSGKLDSNCANCLYINNMHGRNFKDFSIGAPLTIMTPGRDTTTYIFAGIIKELAAPAGFYFLSNKDLTTYDELFIKLKKGIASGKAASQIEDLLQKHDIKISQVSDVSQRLAALEAHLAPTFLIIQVMGIFTILIGLIGLVIVLSLTIEERTNEIGILKAVGSSTQKIIGLLLNEFLTINLITIVLGVIGALLLTPFLSNLFGNMLLGTGFMSFTNFGMMASTIILLLLLQTLLIMGFSRRKVKRNVRLLLG
ncbi:MAG: FtsX-like permease family protein [Saprospiraceae bacterium]|nr:FtsX-like permease family protein [Saprospiraceae bacterium]